MQLNAPDLVDRELVHFQGSLARPIGRVGQDLLGRFGLGLLYRAASRLATIALARACVSVPLAIISLIKIRTASTSGDFL